MGAVSQKIRYRNIAIASLGVLTLIALLLAAGYARYQRNATARLVLRSAAALRDGTHQSCRVCNKAWNIRHDDNARGALINAFYGQNFSWPNRLHDSFYEILHKSPESIQHSQFQAAEITDDFRTRIFSGHRFASASGSGPRRRLARPTHRHGTVG